MYCHTSRCVLITYLHMINAKNAKKLVCFKVLSVCAMSLKMCSYQCDFLRGVLQACACVFFQTAFIYALRHQVTLLYLGIKP